MCLLLTVVFQLLIVGCAIGQNDGFALPEGITDVNQSLRLTLVEETFSIHTGTIVLVENVSDYGLIYFDADTDVKLFVLQDGKWLPVENFVDYLPSGDRFLGPSAPESPSPLSFSVEPFLPGLESKTKLRALVVATVMENNQPTDTRVAAYIDLWVEP
jgi:hypothetical protein